VTNSFTSAPGQITVPISRPSKIISKANEGASFLSYFGHAGANTTEVDLGEPLDYNNANNPLIMYFGGCVLGGCYEEAYSMGEDFLKSPTGAVAWIASSTFSFESTVYEYTRLFYKEMANDNYGEEIGQIIHSTVLYSYYTYSY